MCVALRKESVDRNGKSKRSKTEKQKSLSARRAWIEIPCAATLSALAWSLSARRAWIEMLESKQIDPSVMVALRKESVDRNEKFEGVIATKEYVALRKESVDRNLIGSRSQNPNFFVALRKESVDRNLSCRLVVGSLISRSPQGERG